jgi:hypothetical protein
MFRKAMLISAILAGIGTLAQAHEFWIDPLKYHFQVGEAVQADLRVGQTYKGSRYSYNPQNFSRFELAINGNLSPVKGRAGDTPALDFNNNTDGLAVIVHVTNDIRLTYREWSKFTDFVAHKDFTGALARHAARNLPQTGFEEVYSRYAKALVAVGSGAGQDQQFALETELTALANPYTDDMSGGMPVLLTYQGQPRRNKQIEIFEKMDGVVNVTLARTNENGIANIPVRPGAQYMLDAVVLREPANKGNAVWESLWANLVFSIPK